MTDKQIWQTIALDLKRAANFMHAGRKARADYYLTEAKELFSHQQMSGKWEKIREYIKFEGQPEDLLLGSSLIAGRV